MGIESFRRRAREITTSKRGNRGNIGFWNRWRPPKFDPDKHSQPVAEPVIFIDAEYVDPYRSAELGEEVKQPFFHVRQHTFKYGPRDFRTLVCSSGADQHNPQPCVSCVEVDHGRAKAPARDQLAFNIAHLVSYHKVPYVKDGQIQYKKDSKEATMITVQCDGRGCKYCKDGAETSFGEHKYMQVGTGHLGNILSWDSKVSNFCANCTTAIGVLGYECSGCSSHLLDLSQTDINDEELTNFTRDLTRCTGCGEADYPREVIRCGFDPTGQQQIEGTGCEDTQRLSLFDVVLYLQREGEGTDTKMVDVSWIPKNKFPTPDGQPIDDVLSKVVEKPFEFESVFAPVDVAQQAQILGVENPYQASTDSHREYGRSTPGRPDFG